MMVDGGLAEKFYFPRLTKRREKGQRRQGSRMKINQPVKKLQINLGAYLTENMQL